MSESIADLARRLALEAEAVCRHYLSNGRRRAATGWWATSQHAGPQPVCPPPRPESGKGAAGKWTDYVARRVMLRPRDWALLLRGDRQLLRNIISVRGEVA